mgnify:FL=1
MSFEYHVSRFLAAAKKEETILTKEVFQYLQEMAVQLNTDLAQFYVSWMNKYLESREARKALPEAFIFEQGTYSNPAYLSLNKRLMYALKS